MGEAAATWPGGRSVFLVTGEQVSPGAGGRAGVSVAAGGPGPGTESAGPLEALSQGGTTLVMPVTAAPYLGRGLAAALFEPRALARAESAGRLPVRISYSGRRPALPGVTITSSGAGTATGYLTAAGARAFGSALARQYAADHARASYGQDGIFRGVDIRLAGTPAPAPVARPAYQMRTVIVSGTNLAGRPDTGDLISVFNVDDGARLGAGGGSPGVFDHGTARFSVPAGHYTALAEFYSNSGLHLVVVQFSVGRTAPTTTLHVSARSASSRMTFTTPRPAVLQEDEFSMVRLAARYGGFFYYVYGGRLYGGASLWISPTTARPTAGMLQTDSQATLTSPSSARGTPYAYRLDFPAPGGIVPAQHFSPGAASLATVHEHYYQDLKSSGSWCTLGGYVYPAAFGYISLSGCNYFPLRLPQDQTQYLSAGPSVIWQSGYTSPEGGQANGLQAYRPGQQVTQDWGAYPLHPQPDVQTLRGLAATGFFPAPPSAFRAGDTLTLSVTPFSDNDPGHFSPGYTAGVTGSYAVDQNGVRIAHGNPALRIGPVKVSARPSVITFTLTARRHRPRARLSTASTTTWTWHTRREPAATVPPAWSCYGVRQCAVQPMMTLDYHVAGLALDGTTAAGPQVIGLDVGHIQPGGQARITRVTAEVSFNGGRSWRPATITTPGRGQFQIAFTARPGAYVTLRTRATDAAGNSITETIQRAYQVASHPASGAARPRAACPLRGPRQARCYALYAPQVTVDRAIAARAAGRPVAADATTPKGWGATDIEQAYQLPVRRRPHATVAVVDAYSTPHLAADLAIYRARYHLPPCTTASGCLRIVNQHGQAAPLPAADPQGWGVEETLDVSMVSAACPRCRILVVEARSPAFADLAAAEDTAARLGAVAISNSYGNSETGYSQAYAPAYHHHGHVIVASSGDAGFGPAQFPANLAAVTAVGGTRLSRSRGTRGWAETTWNAGGGASGSGCSAYVTKPAWQHDPHCPGRTIADVAAVAWNIPVYDSSVRGGPWLTVGGTSASAPLIAGVYALAGNAATVPPGYEYAHRGALFDITTGTSDLIEAGAACGDDYLCVAKKGYDAPTGLGTPHGTGAF